MFTTDPHNKPQIIKRSELIIVKITHQRKIKS